MRKKTTKIAVFLAALALAASATACTPKEKKVDKKAQIETSIPVQVSKEKNTREKKQPLPTVQAPSGRDAHALENETAPTGAVQMPVPGNNQTPVPESPPAAENVQTPVPGDNQETAVEKITPEVNSKVTAKPGNNTKQPPATEAQKKPGGEKEKSTEKKKKSQKSSDKEQNKKKNEIKPGKDQKK